MRVQLLAKRYAQALFDLAVEMKILDKVEKDMALINAVLEENRNLRKVLANPVMDDYKKTAIIQKIFEGHIQKLTLRFLVLVTTKNREMYIGPICAAFLIIFKEYKNIMPVTITTAYVPEKKIKDEILSKLAHVTKKELEVSDMIDEDIIGGFKLDFEDYQYDNSVKIQLKRLQKMFSENLYKSKI